MRPTRATSLALSVPFLVGIRVFVLGFLPVLALLAGADQQSSGGQAAARERPIAPAGLPAAGSLRLTEMRFVDVPVKIEARVREDLRVERGERLNWADLVKLSETLRLVDPRLTLGISVSDAMDVQLTVRRRPSR